MFSFDRELRFGDCDPAGMAYFPAYLNIMNGVVEEFWTNIGFPWRGLIMDRKIGTPTLHLDCHFSRPSIFGDLLMFKLAVRRVGRRRSIWLMSFKGRTAFAGRRIRRSLRPRLPTILRLPDLTIFAMLSWGICNLVIPLSPQNSKR